jgi:hypothetical protein
VASPAIVCSHQPLFALPPDDVGGVQAGFLDMGGNHREVIGIERNQFELGRHRSHLKF